MSYCNSSWRLSYSKSFRSIGKISRWLLNSIVALIIINILNLILPILQVLEYLIRGVITIGFLWSREFDFFLGLIAGVIGFTSIIVTLLWFYRATDNIHAFGAKEVSSPRMAVLWFFIPIFNLWKPYLVAQQIWKASNPQTVMIKGTEWKDSSASSKIKLLWILTLVYLSLYVIGNYYSTYGNIWNDYLTTEQTVTNFSGLYRTLFYANLFNIMGMIVGIYSQVLSFQIVKQISIWQETIDRADSNLK
jgi:hypothetical protein